MWVTLFVWALCSVVVLAGLLFGRTSRLQGRLRLADLNWKAMLLLSVIVGGVPAFVFDQLNHRKVEVPSTIADDPVLPPVR
jgi:hypothetical protein